MQRPATTPVVSRSAMPMTILIVKWSRCIAEAMLAATLAGSCGLLHDRRVVQTVSDPRLDDDVRNCSIAHVPCRNDRCPTTIGMGPSSSTPMMRKVSRKTGRLIAPPLIPEISAWTPMQIPVAGRSRNTCGATIAVSFARNFMLFSRELSSRSHLSRHSPSRPPSRSC